MKQILASSSAKGFAAGILLCAGVTVAPSYIQQSFAQQQSGGPTHVLHAPGTFMLSAAGGQSSGVYLVDTRTGDTWYIVPGGKWSSVGSPVLVANAKPEQPQK